MSEDKSVLRTRVLGLRDAMPAGDRASASETLSAKLLAHPRFLPATRVLAYAGFGTEVDTHAFLKAVLATGKMLALPRIDKASGMLALYRVTDPGADLEAGPWGIREPKPDPARRIVLADVDFVLTPGLAFDARCNRLGYGKAYYDRLFAGGTKPLPFRIAAAFDCQIVERVPVSATDVSLDAIVTPTRDFNSP